VTHYYADSVRSNLQVEDKYVAVIARLKSMTLPPTHF